MQSDSLKELAGALAKAQSELHPVKKDAENPFFKSSYADITAVWETIRGPLSRNGLSVIQTTEVTEKGVQLVTILLHTSGQFLTGHLPLNPVKPDPQSMGSAITYARRYSLMAMVGVTAEDEDDDGNLATDSAQSTKPKQTIAPVVGIKISPDQRKNLAEVAKKRGWTTEQVMKIMAAAFHKSISTELTRDEYGSLVDFMESGDFDMAYKKLHGKFDPFFDNMDDVP